MIILYQKKHQSGKNVITQTAFSVELGSVRNLQSQSLHVQNGSLHLQNPRLWVQNGSLNLQNPILQVQGIVCNFQTPILYIPLAV